jgi:spermine oxidase
MVLAISIVEDYKDDLKTYRGSLGDFIVGKFRDLLNTDDHKDIDRTLAFQFLDFFHKYENSIEASDTWFDTSGQGYLHYWDCDGDRLLNWKDKGYRTIFDLLAKRIPDPSKALPIESRVLLNKTVTNIAWSRPEQLARVFCADGSVIDADHVIVTVSLGVLKEK